MSRSLQLFYFSGGYFPAGTRSGAPLLRTVIKSGHALPRWGGFVHRPTRAVAAIHPQHGLVIAAQWWCGDASADVEPIPANAVAGMQRCAKCDDAALGPAVYRFFDAANVLLYIGSAERFLKRRSAHSRAGWWPRVAREEVQRFTTLAEAHAAEVVAIRSERPVYNVTHKSEEAAA
jgi:hypothetical protein